MISLKTSFIVIAIFLNIVASVRIPASIPSNCITVTIPDNKDDIPIQAKVGQTISLKFPGNMSTGYSYYLISPANKAILKPTNLDEHNSGVYQRNVAAPGIVGAGGFFIFNFNALKQTNSIALQFQYKKPWELNSIRKVNVIVKLIK